MQKRPPKHHHAEQNGKPASNGIPLAMVHRRPPPGTIAFVPPHMGSYRGPPPRMPPPRSIRITTHAPYGRFPPPMMHPYFFRPPFPGPIIVYEDSYSDSDSQSDTRSTVREHKKRYHRSFLSRGDTTSKIVIKYVSHQVLFSNVYLENSNSKLSLIYPELSLTVHAADEENNTFIFNFLVFFLFFFFSFFFFYKKLRVSGSPHLNYPLRVR